MTTHFSTRNLHGNAPEDVGRPGTPGDCPNLDDVPGSRGWGVSGSDCRAESDGPEAADEGGGGMGGEGREGREVEAIEDGPVDDWLQSGPGSLH
jgi:hypothetical protein